MKQTVQLSSLVSKAQQGDRQSRELLAEQVRQKVSVYLYRMTLDYHLAQDLTQETVLQMIESLHQLKVGNTARIWAWIYRTALGKLQHHHRLQGQNRLDHNTVVDHEELKHLVDRNQDTVIIKAQRREMAEAVTQSLNTLKLTYRSVLILRCFEQLSYAEIASVTGRTEMQARLCFFRAKKALQRKLSRRGINRDSLLTALSLFGTLTALRAKNASAATVSAGVLETGTCATVLGMALTPIGLVAMAALVFSLAVGPFDLGPMGAKETSTLSSIITVAPHINTDMIPPARIADAHDPDENGWMGLFPQGNNEFARSASLDPELLIRRQWRNCSVLLPEGHWLSFGFPSPLVNDRGRDIRCLCLNTGHYTTLFLTDGQTQAHRLDNPKITRLTNWKHQLDFDLAGLRLPFSPVAIRVEGHGSANGDKVVLCELIARVNPVD